MLRKVLYIDDDDIMLLIGKTLMKDMSFAKDIVMVANGFDALNYLEAISDSESFPEIIFVDIHMPEMDGWRFLDEFKTRYPGKVNDVYVVLQSSSIDPRELKRADQHEMVNKFIPKPLSQTALKEIFNELQAWNKVKV